MNGILKNKYNLLWENSDLTAEFPAQTISLDSTQYFAVLLKYQLGISTTYHSMTILPKDQTCRVNYVWYSNTNLRIYYRMATLNNNSLTFGAAYYMVQGSSTSVEINSRIIPEVIYGINF